MYAPPACPGNERVAELVHEDRREEGERREDTEDPVHRGRPAPVAHGEEGDGERPSDQQEGEEPAIVHADVDPGDTPELEGAPHDDLLLRLPRTASIEAVRRGILRNCCTLRVPAKEGGAAASGRECAFRKEGTRSKSRSSRICGSHGFVPSGSTSAARRRAAIERASEPVNIEKLLGTAARMRRLPAVFASYRRASRTPARFRCLRRRRSRAVTDA
jgi:hypothetical protein